MVRDTSSRYLTKSKCYKGAKLPLNGSRSIDAEVLFYKLTMVLWWL